MKIGIIQQNYVVGDFSGNATRILESYRNLCIKGAKLVIGSELGILGGWFMQATKKPHTLT